MLNCEFVLGFTKNQPESPLGGDQLSSLASEKSHKQQMLLMVGWASPETPVQGLFIND